MCELEVQAEVARVEQALDVLDERALGIARDASRPQEGVSRSAPKQKCLVDTEPSNLAPLLALRRDEARAAQHRRERATGLSVRDRGPHGAECRNARSFVR